MSAEAEILLDFSKHVPAILRQQLLCELVTNYVIKRTNNHDQSADLEIRPSIQRFHGALLFVDIAGFTVLSQRLDVESLKNNINNYFTRMLGVIDKWGGDVVKFAGDALYVIWPMNDTSQCNLDGYTSTKANNSGAAAKHTAYQEEARESNSGEKTSAIAATGILSKILPSWSFSSFISPKVAPLNTSDQHLTPTAGGSTVVSPTAAVGATPNANLTYLDVHCGLSVGLMAGIDIGYGDRWEYFLTGEPIASVAEAEGAADKGDVVMCAVSHRLLHVDGDPILTGNISATTAHNSGHDNKAPLASIPCKCGCTRVPSGVFKLSQVAPKGVRASRRVSQTRTKSEQEVMSGELTAQDDKLGRAINDDLDMALVAATPLLQKHYLAAAELYSHGSSSGGQRKESFKKAMSPVGTAYNSGSSTKQYSGRTSDRSTSARVADFSKSESQNSENALNEQEEREQAFNTLMHGPLRDHFLTWTRNAMTLGTMYHTHEVARNDFIPTFHVITGHYFNLLGDLFHGNADYNARPLLIDNPTGRDSPALTAVNTVSLEDRPISSSTKQKPLPVLSPDAATAAAAAAAAAGVNNSKYGAFKASTASELRSMTIMFINIIGLDIELTVDAEGSHSRETNSSRKTTTHKGNSKQAVNKSNNVANKKSTTTNTATANNSNNNNSKQQSKGFNGAAAFGFLDRTENESVADELLLKRLQGCIEVLGEAIYVNGGQMRQFIVDDKGTVCIASFGLRGAVNVDNAAVAVEAAQRMITRLQENLGLSASIGITSGKAYSGTVGSPLRHEYAIMGPCVNLSARLMGKCSANNMLCDTETVARDRTHEFVKLSEVIAKGYAYPVGTFAPKKAGLQQPGGQGTPSPNGSVKSGFASLKSASLKSASNLLSPSTGSFGVRAINTNGGSSSRTGSIGKDVTNATMTAAGISEPAYERLWRITENDLYLPIANELTSSAAYATATAQGGRGYEVMISSSQLPIQLRLHGRKDEINTIFKALFTKRNLSGGVIFSLDDAARFIALSGAGGVGKSALVNSLAVKLTSMLRRDLAFNLLIFRNRGSSLHSILPFTSWLPILGELCAAVHRFVNSSSVSTKHHSYHHLHSPKGNNNGSSLANDIVRKAAAGAAAGSSSSSTATGHAGSGSGSGVARGWHAGSTFLSGLNTILQALPSDAQAQKSLLLDALGVTILDSSDPLAKLDERHKLMICAELLAATVSAASRILKKMLLIIMEDVQTIDSWSFSVLYQLWSRGRGVVAILNVSTSVDYASHLITWATDTGIDELDGDGDEGDDDGVELLEHLFSRFDDERRFKVLELQPLSREATLQMARETLGYTHHQTSHSNNTASIKASHGQPALELNNIYEATGGNPLYTVELLKSFQHVRTTNHMIKTSSAVMMNHRVEEIICFRLDKLESAQQIVLKAAAVAAANGRSFDANVISFILLEHDYFHAETGVVATTVTAAGSGAGGGGVRSSFFNAGYEDSSTPSNNKTQLHISNLPLIQAALEELAEHGEFVQCTENTVELLSALDSSLTKSQKKNNVTNTTHEEEDEEELIPRYEFKIPMEKATIYGLIIDEQKQYFHERTALYCGQLLSSTPSRSLSGSGEHDEENSEAALYGEEGYHWQYAGHWGLALQSYYKCGQLRKQTQQYAACLYCLQQAARMVQYMEEETGPALSPFDDTYALKRYDQRFIEIIKIGGDNDTLPLTDVDEDLLRQIEPELETVRELFENDVMLLPIVARLYVELALVQLLGFDGVLHVNYALGAALKLFVTCSFWSQLGHNADSSHVIVDGPGEQTGLFLLTTAAITQLFHPLVSSTSEASEVLPMTGLETALDEINNNIHFETAAQQLQLLSIKIIHAMHSSSNNIEVAMAMLSEVKALRSNDGAINDLILAFDSDLSLLAMIIIIRYLSLLPSDSVYHEVIPELMHTVMQGVLHCTHSLTLVWSILLLTPLLVHNNRCEEALQLLDHHRILTRQARNAAMGHHIGTEAMPPLLHEILRTWIYCCEDLAHRTNHYNTISTLEMTALTEVHLDEQADFITVDHIERIIQLLETRTKGMTLAVDCSSDGITTQLECLLVSAGCGLNYISLDLTLYLASSSTLDTAAYAELQTICCRRIDSLPTIATTATAVTTTMTGVVGRVFADHTMFTTLQRVMQASPSLPVALIKLRLAELLASEPMLVMIETSMEGLQSAAKGYHTFAEDFLQMASTHRQALERLSRAGR